MALPTSGPLGFSDIASELSLSLSNLSLRSMSNTVGFSTPYAVSDFYGVRKPVKIILIYKDCKMEKYFGQFFITGNSLSDSNFLYIDEGTKNTWNDYEGEISDGEYLASYSSKEGIKVISLCKL